MNIMTDQQRQSVTDTALIEMMTEYGYWDHDIGTDGISMETFLRNCFANEGITDIGELDKKCMEYATDPKGDNSLKILCSAYANNEKFRNTVILDADENNGAVVTRTTVYNETTEKDEHTYTVAFCGTRKGYDEWPDNAEGLLNESSAAQRSAANYFDMVSSRFDEDANVVVTGHSKGGNKAQYRCQFHMRS